MRDQRSGFTLIEIVIALAVFLVTSIFILRTLSALSSSQSVLRTKIAAAQYSALMDSVLKTPGICTCHLANPGAAIVINTTGPQSPDVNLSWLRTACEFTNPDNYLVKTGGTLSFGVTVTSVALKKITQTGTPNQYTGMIEVGLTSTEVANLSPLRSPLIFAIDPVTHIPTQCLDQLDMPFGLAACPPGYTMVGLPGQRDNYCVETAQKAAVLYKDAIKFCNGQKPAGYNQARLCQAWELNNACWKGVLSGTSDVELSETIQPLNDGSDVAVARANIRIPLNCVTDWNSDPASTTPGAFRCCID